jgi:hypothetical protein
MTGGGTSPAGPMRIPFQFSHLIEHPRDLLSARCGNTFEPAWVVTKRNHHSYIYYANPILKTYYQARQLLWTYGDSFPLVMPYPDPIRNTLLLKPTVLLSKKKPWSLI